MAELSASQLKKTVQNKVNNGTVVFRFNEEYRATALRFLQEHKGKVPDGISAPRGGSPCWIFCKVIYDIDPSTENVEEQVKNAAPLAGVVWCPSTNPTLMPNGEVRN